MIDVTADDVIAFAPEFEDTPEGSIEAQIENALFYVNEDKWGEKSETGVILMTCHLLKELGFGTGASVTSGGGTVVSERVGDLSRTYGTMTYKSESDQSLASTPYGRQFIRLRNTLMRTPLVT